MCMFVIFDAMGQCGIALVKTFDKGFVPRVETRSKARMLKCSIPSMVEAV